MTTEATPAPAAPAATPAPAAQPPTPPAPAPLPSPVAAAPAAPVVAPLTLEPPEGTEPDWFKRRLEQHERSITKKLLGAVGVEKLEDAKAAVVKARELEEAQKSEIEKANAKAAALAPKAQRADVLEAIVAERVTRELSALTPEQKQAVLTGAGEDPAARTDDAAAERPDPERPEAVLEERPDAVALQRRRVPRVADDEGDAVPPHEPLVRPEPEVAVARLEDRVDAVLRETLLPRVEAVLPQGRRRVERRRAPRDDEERGEDARGEGPATEHPADSPAAAAPRARRNHPSRGGTSGIRGRRTWKSVARW